MIDLHPFTTISSHLIRFVRHFRLKNQPFLKKRQFPFVVHRMSTAFMQDKRVESVYRQRHLLRRCSETVGPIPVFEGEPIGVVTTFGKIYVNIVLLSVKAVGIG